MNKPEQWRPNPLGLVVCSNFNAARFSRSAVTREMQPDFSECMWAKEWKSFCSGDMSFLQTCSILRCFVALPIWKRIRQYSEASSYLQIRSTQSLQSPFHVTMSTNARQRDCATVSLLRPQSWDPWEKSTLKKLCEIETPSKPVK